MHTNDHSALPSYSAYDVTYEYKNPIIFVQHPLERRNKLYVFKTILLAYLSRFEVACKVAWFDKNGMTYFFVDYFDCVMYAMIHLKKLKPKASCLIVDFSTTETRAGVIHNGKFQSVHQCEYEWNAYSYW